MRRRYFLIFLIFGIMLGSCQSNIIQDINQTPQPAINNTALFQNALLTATWAVPSPTPNLQTRSPSVPTRPVLSGSDTPTPLKEFRFMGTTYMGNDLVFGIYSPGISANFKATVNNENYSCFIVESDANMLYCKGTPITKGSTAKISIYPLGNPQPVMSFDVVIPGSPQPTPRPDNQIKLAATNTAPPKADSTEVPCSDWCAFIYMHDGTERRQCGYKSINEAWVQTHNWNIEDNKIGPNTYIVPGSRSEGVECVNEHHTTDGTLN